MPKSNNEVETSGFYRSVKHDIGNIRDKSADKLTVGLIWAPFSTVVPTYLQINSDTDICPHCFMGMLSRKYPSP